jgi:hypothetical protein
MRIWNVDPKLLCRQHILGEHLECHLFVGAINKGTSIKGYIKNGLVEVQNIKKRHDELANEMNNRGYNHKSPLQDYVSWEAGMVDIEQNIDILKNKCAKCKERIDGDLNINEIM